MKNTGIDKVAQALLAARRSRTPCDATPFADALRDIADVYAVHDIVATGLWPQGQAFPRYWKSGGGGNSALPEEGVWTSPADARSWPCNLRLIEAEIALRLGTEVSPDQAAAIGVQQARGLVDAMTVSIELVDSRWRQGIAAPALLKLADMQSHGALVLGEWVPFAARDWAAQNCSVCIGSRPPVQHRGTHARGDPAALLPDWLRHLTREGRTVPAGTVVTTGTWCGMLPAAAGERVLVRFESVGEASVQF